MIVVISALLLLIASAIVNMTLLSGGPDLSVNDKGPKGLSRAFEQMGESYDIEVLMTSPSLMLEEDDPDGTLFVSIGPQRKYTLTEVHALKKFHQSGGRLLLADDTGRINGLTNHFDMTVVKGQLYDETFVGHPDIVKVDDVDLGSFSGFLLLNRPSSVIFSDGIGIIRTSSSSWVDRNGNGIMDNLTSAQGEAPGPRYVGAVSDPDFEDEGKGVALVISDPSLFMNHMIDEEDNLEFIQALIEYLLPDGGKIVIDESVHETSGAGSWVQRSFTGAVFIVTDVNLKIVLGTIAAISVFALAYVHEPPGKHRHIHMLDRTGVAEVVDPDISNLDIPEMRKVLLDKVRVANGMSKEAFSALGWESIQSMLSHDTLYQFARYEKIPKGSDLTAILLEVNNWEKR
jgi:hypothetical protein